MKMSEDLGKIISHVSTDAEEMRRNYVNDNKGLLKSWYEDFIKDSGKLKAMMEEFIAKDTTPY
jgi:hypothetical protein